ncbi:RES family NAD+ phosphorylase [Paralcaligenes ureilyticus]|uniref:RES domain-containing protein n=1 Tax=Paralcaligenes ureilyticus TaxID=627131 RepID=A0A4R3MC19_9BURK|nr:RES family NAD+ phosphorylase [Paralcaligenes ureilyticus]TCT11090.1 RES domain-containing protein [Paralcaligenes ureilyticus]
MILWRVSAFADLSGLGGLLASGRWHRSGRPIVYLAETPSGAMLEVLVHLEIDPEDIPDNLRLLRVDIPDHASVQTLDALPAGWEENAHGTRDMGDSWLRKSNTLLLRVPSAIMPHTHNVLLNPAHPQASLVKVTVETLQLDKRLLKGL